MLCDGLERWDGRLGGRLKREGIQVYIQPIHFIVNRNQHKLVKQLYYNKNK